MAAMTRDAARRLLHDTGLRATAPRVAVLRLLTATPRPLSHAEVVEQIGNQGWDAATLYRNLIKLTDVGLARVASQVGGITRFEAQAAGESPHLHPHFACRDCGEVRCLEQVTLTLPPESRWRDAFRDADVQVVGRCPSCREQAAAATPSERV